MDSEVTDLSEFTAPSSDQLNADDLIAGPRVFSFRRIARGAPDPKDKNKVPKLVIYLHEHPRPWRPCKGMQRLMGEAWGNNPAQWPADARVELWRDPSVAFGEVKDDDGNRRPNITGGVRISGLHPQREAEKDYIVTTGRGQRKVYRVRRLDPPRQQQAAPTLAEVLAGAGLTVADLDGYVVSQGKPATSSLDSRKQQATADKLAGSPDAMAAVRAWVEQQHATTEAAPVVVPEPADGDF